MKCPFCRAKAEAMPEGCLLKPVLGKIDEDNVCEAHRVDLARLPKNMRAQKEEQRGL